MKRSLLLLFILFFAFTFNAQTPTCTASFVYSLSPNGTVTFSNTSINTTTASATYVWNCGNGVSFTTSSISQTVSTTYTSNGTYFIELSMTSSSPLLCNAYTSAEIFCLIQGCPLTPSMVAVNSAPYSSTVNFSSLTTGTIPGTTYNWDFGDGSTGIGSNPTHIYAANGGYGYTLTATNNPTCTSFIKTSIYYVQVAPVKVCGYTPTLTYTLNASGLVDFKLSETATPWYVNWNFSDTPYGALPTQTPSISHVYFNGTYNMNVYLFSTLLNNCGPFSYSAAITVTNNVCNANSAFTFTTGNNGTVQFSKTAPTTNSNIAYSWYFGDGVSSNQVNPTHSYISAGNYKTILISYDLAYPLTSPLDTFAIPCRTFSTANINISNVPCIANSNFSMQASSNPQSYVIVPAYLYNVSSAVWDWGDGSSSNNLYAFHTYSAPGNYNICLTVTTTCGATSSLCANQYLSKSMAGNMVHVSVIAPEITNGLLEKSADYSTMTLYPNPSSDGLLNISAETEFLNAKLEIYDLFTKLVLEMSTNSHERLLQLDISTLNNGIYFFKISSANKSMIRKFIVAK